MISNNLRKLFPNWINVGCFLVAISAFLLLIYQFRDFGRRTWDKTNCVDNLKKVGVAMSQYTQDYDDVLPPRQNNSGIDGAAVSWRSILHSYVKSDVAYRCPINPLGADADSDVGNDLELDGFSRSYAVNSTSDGRYCFGPFADRYWGKLRLNKIKRPELVVGVVETTAAFNDFNILFPQGFARESSVNRRVGYLFSGHKGSANYLYMDGHVKPMRPLDMLDSTVKFNPWTIEGAPFSSSDQEKAKRVLEFSEKQSH